MSNTTLQSEEVVDAVGRMYVRDVIEAIETMQSLIEVFEGDDCEIASKDGEKFAKLKRSVEGGLMNTLANTTRVFLERFKKNALNINKH